MFLLSVSKLFGKTFVASRVLELGGEMLVSLLDYRIGLDGIELVWSLEVVVVLVIEINHFCFYSFIVKGVVQTFRIESERNGVEKLRKSL